MDRASFCRNCQSLSNILYQYDRLSVNAWDAAYNTDLTADISDLFGRLFQRVEVLSPRMMVQKG